ncbi:hypothetical protein Tco_1449692 [Tanacetum coccineum]
MLKTELSYLLWRNAMLRWLWVVLWSEYNGLNACCYSCQDGRIRRMQKFCEDSWMLIMLGSACLTVYAQKLSCSEIDWVEKLGQLHLSCWNQGTLIAASLHDV